MPLTLVIDIGNTFSKIAVFDGKQMLAFRKNQSLDADQVKQFIPEYTLPKACIISSVNEDVSVLQEELESLFPVVELDASVQLPFNNCYATPETLGKDRLAGICAAYELFPKQNVLVVDAGTAITFDILTAAGDYLGGSISPGLQLRYKALHTFTGRLPLLEIEGKVPLIGDSTSGSIHSGVENGAIAEVDGFIRAYQSRFTDLRIILTGGDYNYFDKELKVKTFAAPNLVLEGLNYILNYNLEKNNIF